MPYLGESAALLTSLCWSFNAVMFAWAGKRVGSQTVNLVRLVVAWVLMVLLHLIFFNSVFPFQAGTERFLLLGTSGLIGFALGDAVLFEALVLLGPRLAMLIMTLSPIFSAVLGWIFLHQSLTVLKCMAILVTLGGIAWVVAEHSGDSSAPRSPHLTLGILCGIGGALGQSVGLLFSRMGLSGGFHPISANLIRITAATLGLGLWHLGRQGILQLFGRLQDRRATLQIVGGAITGPVLGVTLSLIAIAHAHMGVAATLMSLTPVILLPFAVLFENERLRWGAVAGTLVSMGGAAALFFL